MSRIARLAALTAIAAALTLGAIGWGGTSNANPGPGNSNQCAPGQHDGQGSADRPASCDK